MSSTYELKEQIRSFDLAIRKALTRHKEYLALKLRDVAKAQLNDVRATP